MTTKQTILRTCGECATPTPNHSLICDKCAPLYADRPPCRYCQNGAITGLPGNACENCLNTGFDDAGPDDSHKRMNQPWGLP